jgi:hypothetical protein
MPGQSHSSIAFPLTLIAVGVILLLKEFGYLHGSILRYWPVLLIVWGIGMIVAARKALPADRPLPPLVSNSGGAAGPGALHGLAGVRHLPHTSRGRQLSDLQGPPREPSGGRPRGHGPRASALFGARGPRRAPEPLRAATPHPAGPIPTPSLASSYSRSKSPTGT